MAVKTVVRMGHPLLGQVAEPVVEFNTPTLDTLLRDMFDTLAAANGAGLAAPQIGVSLRVVVFGMADNPRYPDVEPIAETVLINPLITVIDAREVEAWEGCLSVPGMRGLVSRYRTICYAGHDSQGRRFERNVSGFHARVVQHEVDHLEGILYPRRIRDLSHFGFEEELFPEGFHCAPE